LFILKSCLIFAIPIQEIGGIGLWCNGSTTVFGSVCLGSSPGKPTSLEVFQGYFFTYYFCGKKMHSR
jgi:hypothetical protein